MNKIFTLLHTARRSGVHITLLNGELQVKVSKGNTIDPALLQEIKDNKQRIVEFLSNTNLVPARQESEQEVIPVFDRSLIPHIPLSFSQERLWFIDQLEGSVQYHIPVILRLKGRLDIAALEQAFQVVVNRHEVLRTVIRDSEGQGYQFILPAGGWKLERVDGSGYRNEPAALQQFVRNLCQAPFKLGEDHMLRASLITLEAEEQVLVATMHHIASDGWSASILVKEVVESYQAAIENRAARLEPIPVQYADYALWQRNYLQGETWDKKLGYWKSKLAGAATLQLPTDYTRPAIQTTHGATMGFTLNKNLSAELQAFSHQQGTTLFMTLLAGFKVLLHRYSGQEDISVGTPIANRTQHEVEQLIGFFVNTLALRSEVRGDESFSSLVQQVKTTTLEAYSHQDVPFEKVVEAVMKDRDLSRSPLFQVMFVLQNTPDVPEIRLGDVQLSGEGFTQQTAKYDLSLFMTENSNGLQCSVEYNTDLYKEETIRQMMRHFERLLEAVIKNPAKPVGELPMLDKAEEQQLLFDFNDTKTVYPSGDTITGLFETQAAATPLAIAVVFEGAALSYQELNERSNQLAHYLQARGVAKETLVPVCIERSLDMIIGILGILKAGGAYVPVDPEYPQERISYMLEDTGAKLVVSSQGSRSKLQSSGALEVISLDGGEATAISSQSTGNLSTHPSPGQLAYVIYTSGSTGKPKGVMVKNTGIINLVQSVAKSVDFNNQSTFLSVTTYSFDISYLEFFMPLINGARLVIASREVVSDGFKLAAEIARVSCTHLQATPAGWHVLLAANWKNREGVKILIGGEAVKEDIKESLTAIGQVFNLYGPTETTIWSAIQKLSPGQKVLIGKPVANTRIYILNKEKSLVPVGVSGEICISGAGLANGYLNLPLLTAEKFIDHPFAAIPGEKLYKTGDLGRWLPGGNLEYLGRIDEQVKIRGYRIELGEIETVLQQSGLVKDGVVVVKEDVNANKRLVAYVVPLESFAKEAAQAYLHTRLPEYMVPAIWVELEKLPLTPNGKINRKALPDPDVSEQLTAIYVAPRTTTEQHLAATWQGLLGVEQVGIHDNFFELGGHSLLAMRVIALIRGQLNIDIVVKDIFTYPTIAGLGNLIDTREQASAVPLIEAMAVRPTRVPLSFSQERLWFIHQLEGSVQYHSTVVLRLKGKLDKAALKTALYSIVDRHEILRTVYREEGGQVFQELLPIDEWQFSHTYKPAYHENKKELQDYIQRISNTAFDLGADFLFRPELIELTQEEFVLVVTIHHIASDAWSIPIIVQEVAALYSAAVEKRAPALPALPLQYADYATWQRNFLQPEILRSKLDYWKTKLDGVAPLQLPTDFPRPAVATTKGSSASFHISREIAEKLAELNKANGTTLYMSLLAAFNVLLYRYSGQDDICVGTSIAGRPQQELERLIGFFVNTLPLRNSVKGEMSFTSLLQQVKTTTLEAYDHQEVPFEKVVEAVVRERDQSRSPLFQVMLVLQNTPDAPQLQLGELKLSAEAYEQTTVKFDLTFFINETSRGLQGTVQYSTDLYSAATIGRLMSHYTALLHSIVNAPNQAVGVLPMITEREVLQLTKEFNQSTVNFPETETIVSLFEQQVLDHAGSLAVVFEKESFTYQELNERSNQVAYALLAEGVVLGQLIPICMERSAGMLVAIMGILKAGAAYVPIDIDFPPERISFMLADTDAPILVSDHNSLPKLKSIPLGGVAILEIGPYAAALLAQPVINLPGKPLANDLAYVIYTSGSTGQPKGVMIEHRSIVDYAYGLKAKTGLEQCRSYALVSTIATDLGNTVIFSSLLFGGALHLFSKDTTSNVDALHRYFRLNTIDCLKIVPSHWQALSLEGRPLLPHKLLVFGGEALRTEVIEAIRDSGSTCQVVNHYGPTETTIGKLLHLVNMEFAYRGTVPIGKPFSNTKVYVLSRDRQLAPVGVPGELYIGGTGVSRGYLHNENLTTEKFVRDPFDPSGPLLYKTGDQVKYQEDGNILFIGRVDDQVKIRGYRVEPGEVENLLQQCTGVKQAVVLAREDKQGAKRLVGYVVPANDFDRDGVLAELKQRLPEYMVPAVLMEIDSLPLTANGKINRKALPDPGQAEQPTGKYIAPETELEKSLAMIWADVLEVENIGIHDDFFELGGHSLLAIRLISAIRKQLAIELPISDIFDYPTIALLADQAGRQKGSIAVPAIQPVSPRPVLVPLSFSQERLWFIDQMDGSVQYHVPSVLRLKGNLNKTALAYAIQTIVNRHEVLRTVIRSEKGQAYQHTLQPGLWQLASSEGIQYKAYREQLQDHIQHLINTPFDLTKDHMLRAELIRIHEQEHVLVVVMHHIASDGWSAALLVKEVVALYKSFVEGLAVSLSPMKIQYADFAIWQRGYLEGEVLRRKLDYWNTKLAGVAALELPSDYPRPAIQSNHGAVSGFRLDKELYNKLTALSQDQGTTLFMTLLASFKILLHRYSRQQDICVGTAVAGRQHQELEDLIGFFINTLALRTEIDGNRSFSEILASVKHTTLEAYENQEVPFEKVVNEVVKERDMSRSPLFQVMFALQNTPAVPELLLGDVRLSREPFSQDKTKFDLSVVLTEDGQGLLGTIQYCTDLYSEQRILRMIGHFERLLRAVVANPLQKAGELSMLTTAEKQHLASFNKPVRAIGSGQTIVELIAAHAAGNPDALAMSFKGIGVTYKELEERSGQLAGYLKSKGVERESLVPVCMHRSPDIIIAMLAILKAGAAYVPIDPEYPAERIRYMVEDSNAPIILTRQENLYKLPVSTGRNIVAIDVEWAMICEYPLTSLALPGMNELAYVIYTSGSTGQPKGVMIEHSGLVNLVAWHNQAFKVTASSRATAMAGIGFDAFGWEVWPYLATGASLYIIDDHTRLSTTDLIKVFTANTITHSFISTAVVPAFLEASRGKDLSLKYLLTGGDKLSFADLSGINYSLVNNYGPTENTVVATSHTLTRDLTTVPIGKPILNTTIFILNEQLQLVPIGVPGEICIGGAGLARGYLNRPELTAERFIDNHFSETGGRLYRTGDLGRWSTDGNIEYLGRVDDQVKVRGFRIELGEIENVLMQSPMVERAVVLVKADVVPNQNLVAYIVPTGEFNESALVSYLKERLPVYMVPVTWMPMETLPLTANGKIDKKALPEPVAGERTDKKYVAPRNELELKLVRIWEELLGAENIGIEDNFFERGGNSLLAMRMVAYIEKTLLLSIPIKVLFQFTCISDLSKYLEIEEKGKSSDNAPTTYQVFDL